MARTGPIMDLEALANEVPDGAVVAIPPEYSGVAMAATRALVRRGSNDAGLSGLDVELVYGDLRDAEATQRAVEGCDQLTLQGIERIAACHQGACSFRERNPVASPGDATPDPITPNGSRVFQPGRVLGDQQLRCPRLHHRGQP